VNSEVIRRKQRLDSLFRRASDIEDIEVLAHWARYLCVLCSGFIESSVQIILGTYARNRANREVASFAQQRLRYFQNPTMGKIASWVEEFSHDWADNLRRETEGQLLDAINSIVANRHRIAHGDDVTITMTRIKEYYASAVKVVELLNAKFS
jgi:RiboL-PSP-HEPN